MLIENLATLKIHRLTQEQYDRELAAGRIDPNAIYLTPDEGADLSDYITTDQLEDAVEDALAKAKASGEFKGENGYTPVRGTDYWTEADKAEIKAYIDAAVEAALAAANSWGEF